MSKLFSRPALIVLTAMCVSAAGAAPNPQHSVEAEVTALYKAGMRGGADLSSERQAFIVGFVEPSLASYRGEFPALAQPPRHQSGPDQGQLDLADASADAYLDFLGQLHEERDQKIAMMLGRTLEVQGRFRHAFNGMVMRLSAAEAASVSALPEVSLVEAYREYEVHTDAGPSLIGAPIVWNFSDGPLPDEIFSSGFEAGEMPPLEGVGSRGEGVVIGVIDSGINFPSPSFSATDEHGYTHVNPLGEGNHLGQCASGGVDDGNCNAKVFGAYDFVYPVVCAPGDPGTDPCRPAGSGGTITEEPSATDSNGHGTHTASTAGGNRRTVTVSGADVGISGVAPRANIVAYDTCYTRNSDGRGLCPNVSTLAAIDQAVADGVDVINYSIGGGAQPWLEANSLAFLSAADAGVFVSASAGNSGPGAFTLGHVEPWVATVGASTHGRAGFTFRLNVTGPGEPGSAVTDIPVFLGAAGTDFTAALPPTTPLIVSPGIDSVDDGCAAFPAATFDGAIALIRRGGCSFVAKADNAVDAGAIAVVIANNTAGVFGPGGSGATVPVFMITQLEGDAIRDFSLANAGSTVTAEITYPASFNAGVADVMGDFSSRGPSGFDLVKPDVAAPGLSILAAYAGDAGAIAFLQGTSMAAPHNAGAAALLRDMNPFWSPAQIKSALMMTAVEAMLKEDGSTPADPWDRGAGRIRVDLAARSGLVMDESFVNYMNADPASGGDPDTLNLPSMAGMECILTCSFSRRFQNTGSEASEWTASLQGLPGTVSPASFSVVGHGSRVLDVEIDSSGFAADGASHFGTLVLTPGPGNASPTLHLPIVVAVPEPDIDVTPAISLSVDENATGSQDFDVSNVGGGTVNYTIVDGVDTEAFVINQIDLTSGSGFRSSFYTDLGLGQYAAEDFTVAADTKLQQIVGDGFTLGANPVSAAASITFTIYEDAGGVPAGNPDDGGAVTPVWTYSAAPGSAGLVVTGDLIEFDAIAAGEDLTLAAGTYWLIVHADVAFADRWVWFSSNNGSGFPARAITPSADPGWGNTGTGLSTAITQAITCGTPWITGVTPASGDVGALETDALTVDVDAAGLTAGDYVGFVCVSSDDADEPIVPVRVELTVTTPAP